MSNVKVEMDFADRLAEKIYGEPRLDQTDCAKIIRDALASLPVREEVGEVKSPHDVLQQLASDAVPILTLCADEVERCERTLQSWKDEILRSIPDTAERLRLLEATLNLIANPELQNDYTPQQLARHALRIEPLPPTNTESKGGGQRFIIRH